MSWAILESCKLRYYAFSHSPTKSFKHCKNASRLIYTGWFGNCFIRNSHENQEQGFTIEVDRLTTQSIVDNQVDNQELVVNLDVDFTKLVVDPKSDMLIFFTILQFTSEGQI